MFLNKNTVLFGLVLAALIALLVALSRVRAAHRRRTRAALYGARRAEMRAPDDWLLVLCAVRSERAFCRTCVSLYDQAYCPHRITLCVCFYDAPVVSDDFINKLCDKRPDMEKWLRTTRTVYAQGHSAARALAHAWARLVHPDDPEKFRYSLLCTSACKFAPEWDRSMMSCASLLSPQHVFCGQVYPDVGLGSFSYLSVPAYEQQCVPPINSVRLARQPGNVCPNMFFTCSLVLGHFGRVVPTEAYSEPINSFITGLQLYCNDNVETLCFPYVPLANIEIPIENVSQNDMATQHQKMLAMLDAYRSSGLLQEYERLTGLRLQTFSSVGRALLGVSRDPQYDEIVSKYGTMSEYEAQKSAVLS